MDTTTTEGPLATVNRFYELIPAGRLDEVAALLHDDLVIREPAGLPYGGDYHGPAGFADIMGRIVAALEIGVAGPVDVREAGDCVLVRFVGRFASRSSGASVETDIVELFTVHDSKITELDVYYKDPGAVAALVAD